MEDGETVAGRTSSLLYGRPRTGLRTFRIIINFISIENLLDHLVGSPTVVGQRQVGLLLLLVICMQLPHVGLRLL